MRRRPVQREHAFEAINVTPLIDVVMCLIVFFLLVGKLANDRSAALPLPKSSQGETDKPPDVLIVTVQGAPGPAVGGEAWPAGVPTVSIEDRPSPGPAALERFLRARLAERPLSVVQVRAERSLDYGAVQPVLAACARAGAKTVRLALERVQ